MKIYLIRHAVAETKGPKWEGRDDERPLTRAGIRRFRRAVKGMRQLDIRPGLILTSPAVRAMHTASWLMAGLRLKGLTTQETDALRPDRPPRLPDELKELSPDSEVVLIGHTPHLTRLASYLISGHEDLRLDLKKGGMITLSLEDLNAPGTAVLLSALTQRQLRLMA